MNLNQFPQLNRHSLRFSDDSTAIFYLSLSKLSVRDRVVLEGEDLVIGYLLSPADKEILPGTIASVENTPYTANFLEERRNPVPGLFNRNFNVRLVQRVYSYQP